MKCTYCGEDCGFLKTDHIDCENSYEYIKDKLSRATFYSPESDSYEEWNDLGYLFSSPFLEKWFKSTGLNCNFQKSEYIVWIFNAVQYLEMKHTKNQSGVQAIDIGKICLTSKHIYFLGKIKKFKIPFKKIISIEGIRLDGFRNSIQLQQDITNAKLQYFILMDASDREFAFNLFSKLTDLNLDS